MKKYVDYNIISLGDHCAIPSILKELNLRQASYPFDWVGIADALYDNNIMYNVSLVNEIYFTENIDNIVEKYIGNLFENENKINSLNNLWFPHETESKTHTLLKYKRRFVRLKTCLNQKNIFILLTRHSYIKEEIFKNIINILLSINNNSIILFISGTDHPYLKNINCSNIIFKHINYDISKYYEYDYTPFRPNIKKFLIEFFT
jgi:hypothetical protein